jgi:hypothetical protein
MPPFSPGDRFEVTNPAAPFAGYTGVVDEIEEGNPFPVVSHVTYMDSTFPVSYTVDDITPLLEPIAVAEAPVMGT